MGIIVTGGSGRLGQELKILLPEAHYPSHSALDICDEQSVNTFLQNFRPDILVHAAAYTNVTAAEKECQAQCWTVNVTGTQNIARACINHGIRLVHISTDYVFDGKRGNYQESDLLGPAINYYSLTKIVAESVAMMARYSLIIRTSFRPRAFQYPTAFDDVFTSQDYVDVIAPEVVLAIHNLHAITFPVLHIATERKSVYELASRRSPSVLRASKAKSPVALPDDVSLNCDRWNTLKASFSF